MAQETKFTTPIFASFEAAKRPVFKEVNGKDWIYFGEKNEYPQYLISLFNRSSKHNAIICGKSKYILGKGWSSTEKINNLSVRAMLENYIQNPNPDENLNELTRKIILDYELFRGFAIEIIWNKAGSKIAEIRHVNFANVRKAKKEKQSEPDRYFYSEKWIKILSDGTYSINPEAFTDKDESKIEYKSYDPEEKKKGVQLLYYKAYRPDLGVYPLPDYLPCIDYINLDFKIPSYWHNQIVNGFHAGHLINFIGTPTPEEKKKIEKQISEKYSDPEKAGKPVVSFSRDREHASEIQTIPMTDADKQYVQLNETVQNEIFVGHGISNPMLFGIKTPGQLGGRTELIEANELFENIYVSNSRAVVELIINKLISHAGLKGMLKLVPTQPIGVDILNEKIWNILPNKNKFSIIGIEKEAEEKKNEILDSINTLSPLIVNNVIKNLTVNELRAIIKMPPIVGGDVISSAPSTTETTLTQFSHEDKEMGSCITKVMGEGKSHEQAVAICINKKKDYMDRFKTIGEPCLKYKILSEREIDFKVTEQSELDFKMTFVEEKKNKDRIITTPTVPKDTGINPKQEDIFVKYKYGWRKGFDNSDLDTSREFCRELIELDRLYTRPELDSLDNGTELDVFESGGGWYTMPGTDTSRPSCRHVWKQTLVTKLE